MKRHWADKWPSWDDGSQTIQAEPFRGGFRVKDHMPFWVVLLIVFVVCLTMPFIILFGGIIISGIIGEI